MKIKKIFEIELDEPNPYWLCADNLAIALNDYCRGAEANFVVKELARYPDYPDEKIEHKNVWSGVRRTCSPKDMSSFDEEQSAIEKAGKVKCEAYTWRGYRVEPPLNIIDRDMEGNAFDERVRKIEEKIGKFGCLNPIEDIIYGDSAENIYEQSIAREKKRCEELGIEMPEPIPFNELSAVGFADTGGGSDKLKSLREKAKEHNEQTYPSIKDRDKDLLPPGVQKCFKCGIIMSANSAHCFNCGAECLQTEAKKRPRPYDEQCYSMTAEDDPVQIMTEEEKRARFYKELSKLGNSVNSVIGTGMCAGCGKVRGSMAIYGGVPCEECGYTPERVTTGD
jgi:hypothetical protein